MRLHQCAPPSCACVHASPLPPTSCPSLCLVLFSVVCRCLCAAVWLVFFCWLAVFVLRPVSRVLCLICSLTLLSDDDKVSKRARDTGAGDTAAARPEREDDTQRRRDSGRVAQPQGRRTCPTHSAHTGTDCLECSTHIALMCLLAWCGTGCGTGSDGHATGRLRSGTESVHHELA